MIRQGQLDFEATGIEAGHERWVSVRKVAAKELARKINLPLGHMVEVWLRGNIRLRGRLRLKEEILFLEESAANHLELMVDNVPFTCAEMESCVRLD